MYNFHGQIKQVILSMEDHCTVLKTLLSGMVDNPMQAYHELIHAVVEAVRWRDRSTTEIVRLVTSVHRNMSDDVACKAVFAKVLRTIAQSIQYQAEAYNLYDDKGVMMFTYHRHPSDSFDDVMVASIIPLKYNGGIYEPPIL